MFRGNDIFYPKYNAAGSFVNDRFGVGFSQVRFKIFLVLFIVLLIKLWFDLEKECINKGYNQKWMFVYDLFIAACFARAFERLGGIPLYQVRYGVFFYLSHSYIW